MDITNQQILNTAAPPVSYYQKRLAELGINPEHNRIDIWQSSQYGEANNGDNILKSLPIFRESAKGIEILVYTLDRNKIPYNKDGKRWKDDYCITRMQTPIVKANGDIIKYLKPAGEPSFPFLPPKLIDKYDKANAWLKENPQKPLPKSLIINTLYSTEGFFKAFKADMHGINCIGLQSITCLRDKRTNQIWEDITKIINTCKVERFVWLTDGDFMNITSKDLTDGIDLYKRPNIFFNSVSTFYEITSNFDCERYFAHINTEELEQKKQNVVVRPGPKGLDDLLCNFPDTLQSIVTEFNNFSIMAPGKVYPGTYITRINISIGIGNVRKYILKDNVTDFYLFHLERRKELRDIATFKYNGTEYRYDEKEGTCIIEVPGKAADYIRAGNDYYKHITYPDKKGKPLKSLEGRTKTTIVDDHGKEFIQHIKKYDRFCIVPNHFNYQPVIQNCYNIYHQFRHEPEEGDCSATIDFFKHIFSEEQVKYTKDGKATTIPRYELGLDYMTLAYKCPWQMLPILCLVSKERQTGKTTFVNYINAFFENNAISIGNEDLEADFNAHWAGKLFIMVDETKVDSGKVINKIKRLSTAGDIIMNAKGKDQTTLPFFAKFVLNSNHVEDFIKIDREEIRFWIHKVKPIPDLKTDFLQTLIDEIPAFLHFLNTRKMVSKSEERHWFNTQLLQTDALDVVKANSVSNIEKRIRIEIQEFFELCEKEEIYFPLEILAKEVLKVTDKIYIKRTLNNMGYLTERTIRGKFPRRVESFTTVLGQPPLKQIGLEWVGFVNSCYKFNRKDFISEIANLSISETDLLTAEPVVVMNDLPF